MIGGAEQRGALVEMQRDVALEHDGRAQIRAGNQANRAAALCGARIDGALNRGRIFADAVALGAKVARIAGLGCACRASGCSKEERAEERAG